MPSRAPGSMIISISPQAKKVLGLLSATLFVCAIAAVVYFQCLAATVNANTYQAVFLSNGQVYFGRVSNPWSKYVRLTDIYYLQTKEGLQSQDLANIASGDMTLIKLGKELHGPTDKMEINREHILFMEDLKDDSKVIKAIKDFKGK